MEGVWRARELEFMAGREYRECMTSDRHDADVYIRALGLIPHPEGGYYRQTYRAAGSIDADCLPRHGGPRSYSTAVYYLLRSGEFSALHRIRSDEVWHFYAGSGLTVHEITPQGAYRPWALGPNRQQGQQFQAVVEAGSWFGADVGERDSFALTGCTVAPGFDFDDFEIGRRADLLAEYPHHRKLILALTRE